MEKQTLVVNRIGLIISLILLTSFIVCLYLIALDNRYMVVDNPFILDKWTKTIYLMNARDNENHQGRKLLKWQDYK